MEKFEKMGLAKFIKLYPEYEETIKDIFNDKELTNPIRSSIITNIVKDVTGLKNVCISEDVCRKTSRDKYGRATDQSKNSAGKIRADKDGLTKEYINKNEDLKIKLEKKKVEVNDLTSAYKKLVRDTTRHEINVEMIKDEVKSMGQKYFLSTKSRIAYDSGKDIIACVSDLHIGQDVKNIFGKYNPEIAKERLSEYIQEIVKVAEINNAENVYVALLGDLISGDIHLTTQLENREGAISQTMIAAELLANFIYELSKYFNKVYVCSVSGNHSRIGFKDDVLRTERLDDIIPWYIETKCSSLENVEILNNKENTIGYFNVRGNDYLICHGDYDKFSAQGKDKLTNFVDLTPTAIFYGHLHHCSFDDIDNIKLIRSGSFCGSYDDYSISKRLNGKATQMVCVATEDGIESMYVIDLEKNK